MSQDHHRRHKRQLHGEIEHFVNLRIHCLLSGAVMVTVAVLAVLVAAQNGLYSRGLVIAAALIIPSSFFFYKALAVYPKKIKALQDESA